MHCDCNAYLLYYVKGVNYMHCENIFCIYWSEQLCSLDEITLDIQGNCKECIYVEINESLLQKQRNKILKKYEDNCER